AHRVGHAATGPPQSMSVSWPSCVPLLQLRFWLKQRSVQVPQVFACVAQSTGLHAQTLLMHVFGCVQFALLMQPQSPPLQFWPPPQGVPSPTLGFDGTPWLQRSCVHTLPSMGLSLSSMTCFTPPDPLQAA